MNEAGSSSGTASEPWAAFQKAWAEAATRMMELGFSGAAESVPPEVLRRMREGILQALSESWDQFLRSPQFLDGMKQWLDQAITFRKATHDFLTHVRHESEAPAREDLDQVVLAVRHLETRVLGRLEALAAAIEELRARSAVGTAGRGTTSAGEGAAPAPAAAPAPSGRRGRAAGSRRRPGTGRRKPS